MTTESSKINSKKNASLLIFFVNNKYIFNRFNELFKLMLKSILLALASDIFCLTTALAAYSLNSTSSGQVVCYGNEPPGVNSIKPFIPPKGVVVNAAVHNPQHLDINSGDCLVSGVQEFQYTTLNGGLVFFDHVASFGRGIISANGGMMETRTDQLSLENDIHLESNGLTVQGANELRLLGTIMGSGSLTKSGSSNLLLNASNRYRGGTFATGGIITLGSQLALGSGTLTVEGATFLDTTLGMGLNNAVVLNADLSLTGNYPMIINGMISGQGGIHKYGSELLELTEANSYSGGSFLYRGMLFLNHKEALSSGALTVEGHSTLDAQSGMRLKNDLKLNAGLNLVGRYLTLNGTISGTGGITHLTSSPLTLNAANSYSGGTFTTGGKLVLGDNKALGSGVLAVDGETILDNWQALVLNNDINLNADLNVGGSRNLVLKGIISGTKGIKTGGTALLTLNGANSYSGGTILSNGSLTLGNDTALGSGVVRLETDLTLNSSIPLTLDNAMVLNKDLKVVGYHDLTLNGVISGTGGISKFGINHLMLNAANSYSGGTSFDNGMLSLGNDAALGSGTLTVHGMFNSLETTTPLTLNNPIELVGDLKIAGDHDLTLNGVISGGEYIDKQGPATLRLNAANSHEGGILLYGGKLLLGHHAALGHGSLMLMSEGGSLDTTTELTLSNKIKLWEADLNLVGSHDLTLNGEILGPKRIIKSGANTLILNAANHYEGGTLFNKGKLLLGHHTALGRGALQLSAEEVSLDTLKVLTLDNNIELNADLNVAGSQDLTLNGIMTGIGKIIKSGSVALKLNQPNDYSGGTVLNNGKLLLGNDTALGSGILTVEGAATLDTTTRLALDNPIELGADLHLNGSHDLTLNGVIWGGRGVTKSGSGTLTLNSSNRYTGGTVLNDGKLLVGSQTALGSGALTVAGSATLDTGSMPMLDLDNAIELKADLDIAGRYAILNGPISGPGGITKSTGAPLTLNGVNSYSGDTILYDGELLLGRSAALGSGKLVIRGAAILDNKIEMTLDNAIELNTDLKVMGRKDLTLNGVMTGDGGITKFGNGTLTLNAANHYGGVTVLDDGVLVLGAGGSFAANSAVNITGSEAQLDISAAGDQTIGSLIGVTGSGVNLGEHTLTFGDGSNQTFAGVISGSGGLIKAGRGKAILSGTNTFTGHTTINAGTLQIGDGGTTGSLVGDIINHGSLIFNHANKHVFGGVISGIGNLVKEGNGVLVLAGNNTYSGMTVVNAGTLEVTGSLAHAEVNVNNGATFQAAGTIRDVTIGSGATVSAAPIPPVDQRVDDLQRVSDIRSVVEGADDNNHDDVQIVSQRSEERDTTRAAALLAAPIAAAPIPPVDQRVDDLQRVSDIRSVVEGADDNNHDDVQVVSQRSEERDTAGAAALLAAPIAAAPIPPVDQRVDDLQRVSDIRSVVEGADDNNHDDVQVVSQRSEERDTAGAAALLAAPIAAAPIPPVDQRVDDLQRVSDIRSVVEGADDNNHDDVQVVSQRSEEMDAARAAALLAAPVFAAPTPPRKEYVDSLRVAGNINFSSGSFYDVRVTPQKSGIINVAGNATLSGAAVKVAVTPGRYQLVNRYTILTADGGFNGMFVDTTSDLVFLTPSLRQDANRIFLTLSRNDTTFEQTAQTRNQKSVARARDNADATTLINRHLLPLDMASVRTAFDHLSGEIQASAQSILLAHSHYTRETVMARTRGEYFMPNPATYHVCASHDQSIQQNKSFIPNETCSDPVQETATVWGQVLAGKGNLKGGENTNAVNYRTTGFVMGSDMVLNDRWHVGAAGALGHTFFNTNQIDNSGSVNHYHLALYGGTGFGALAVRLGAAYTWHHLDIDRRIVFPSFSERAQSRYNAGTMQFLGELGYAITAGSVMFEPFVSLDHINLYSDGFTETGGASALVGNKNSQHVAFSSLGLRARTSFDILGLTVSGHGSIGWRRGFGDLIPRTNLTFGDQSTTSFEIIGVPITDDSTLITSGIDVKISKKFTLGLGYSGQFAAKMQDNAINARVIWEF